MADTAETAAQLLLKVKGNVLPKKGLSNGLVQRFCKLACSSDFKGVYSADYLPPKLPALSNFIVVVNLGVRKGVRYKLPAGHFVTIYATPARIYYVDPYGIPSVEPHVNQFLERCGRPVVCNLRQIQDFGSVYCGLYAVLFACYVDKRPNFRLLFERRRLLENDKLCLDYLQKLFNYHRG